MPAANKKFSLEKVGNYFRESKSELKKIVWASPKQVVNNSIIVIVGIIVAGAVISAIDFGFTTVIQLIIGLFGA